LFDLFSGLNIKREDVSTKYLNYSDGILCNFSGKPSIVACGYQSTSKHVISQVDVSRERGDSQVNKYKKNQLNYFYKNKIN